MHAKITLVIKSPHFSYKKIRPLADKMIVG